MRIIAATTSDSLGLIKENEVLNATDELKEILVELGLAEIYDDTKPRVGKSVNVYESGMSYPPERQIIYNDSIYISNTTTSTTWVGTEWDILVTGKNSI